MIMMKTSHKWGLVSLLALAALPGVSLAAGP